MKISHVEVGICGLSCRLCPAYYRETKSRCGGCKSEFRMGAPCPFHNCAIKKKGVEFCGFCPENSACEKWIKHRKNSREHDSIVCYQKLEDNVNFIMQKDMNKFEEEQRAKEKLLRQILSEFNDGRSKTFYCVAATILEIDELELALKQAREKSRGLDPKQKAEVMHTLLDKVTENKHYLLKLRK